MRTHPGFILFAAIICAGTAATVSVAALPTPEEQAKSLTMITRNAGRVGQEILTTRGVQISSWIEDALYRESNQKRLGNANVLGRDFIQETTAVLLEAAIATEAADFPASQVTPEEVRDRGSRALAKLKKSDGWKQLQVTDAEFEQAMTRKLRSKKFIKFKMDLASLPVSDQEVKDYYDKNKFKFDNLPFENFKENIRSFLTRRQVDERMKEWFEVLHIKYRIRNSLAEEKI